MKILLYNYVLPNEPRSPGRGVTKYLQSLIEELAGRGHTIFLLGAGDRYSLIPCAPSLKQPRDKASLVIYDSPLVAPAIHSFHHPSTAVCSTALDTIPAQIKAITGVLDVVHFHNMEGLTHGFFKEIKRVFPQARFFYTAHNYNLVCPQVNLWQRNTKVCSDDADSAACVECQYGVDRYARKRLVNALKTKLKDLPPRLAALERLAHAVGDRVAMKATDTESPPAVSGPSPTAAVAAARQGEYRRLRQANVDLCRTVFDRVLAVSDRTRNLLIERGLPAECVDTLRIGTEHHRHLHSMPRKSPRPDALNIGYVGYMAADKGFYYFLEAIESLPADVAGSMGITIAATVTDKTVIGRFDALRPRFRSFRIYDGYTHADYPHIVSSIDLGIVPSTREDNFPLVALELVCHGIPILTSDRGGAREIASDDSFVFSADSPLHLVSLLLRVIEGQVDLSSFWRRSLNVISVSAHADNLINRYYLGGDKTQGSGLGL